MAQNVENVSLLAQNVENVSLLAQNVEKSVDILRTKILLFGFKDLF